MSKMKVMTLLGIRPDIIRMFKLIKLLDDGQNKYDYKHIFCHTGQHFDYELDKVFYDQLGVRYPDTNMNVGKTLKERGGQTTHAYQIALLFEKTAEMIEKKQPDVVMYLGDTNSVLSSIIVSRYGIPVVHIEAGGRSYDWRMPEEKNRLIIDHLSDALYCYMPRHKEILLQEGIDDVRVKVVGNIIYDAIAKFLPLAENNNFYQTISLSKKSYVLVTLHREENIQNKEGFIDKISQLIKLSNQIPVVLPLMPRVKKALENFDLWHQIQQSKIIITKPLGYLEFLNLQNNAKVIITDSGTVQEEAVILGVPAVILRRSTERPETVLGKASVLHENDIINSVEKSLLLSKDWDRNMLNPIGGSPSDIIFEDMMQKIETDFFKQSRQYSKICKNQLVREAYGIISEK